MISPDDDEKLLYVVRALVAIARSVGVGEAELATAEAARKSVRGKLGIEEREFMRLTYRAVREKWIGLMGAIPLEARADKGLAHAAQGASRVLLAYAGPASSAAGRRLVAARVVLKNEAAKDPRVAELVATQAQMDSVAAELMGALGEKLEALLLALGGVSTAEEGEVDPAAQTLRASFALVGGNAWDDGPPTDGNMFLWDARLAELAQPLGEPGAKWAANIREKSPDRLADHQMGKSNAWGLFRLWLPEAAYVEGEEDPSLPPFVEGLARALWRAVVLPRIRKPAALVRPVMIAVTDFHARRREYNEQTGWLSFKDDHIAVIDSGATVDAELLRDGLTTLGSLVSHKVLRWEVFRGHERAIRGEPYANILDVPGGWTALAQELGLNPKRYAHAVRAVVYAQAHATFTFPDGSRGNMLVLTEKPAQGRTERARVTITLGHPLLPGYTAHLAGAQGVPRAEMQRARKLVPMPRTLPPLFGRENEHGAQITLSLAVMVELRERAAELVTDGGALISHDRFTQMADRSFLARKVLMGVLDRWLAGDQDAPPFLARMGKDRYTLADAHQAERDFLEQAGKAEVNGREAGKKSAASRRAAVRRKAGKRAV